MSIPSQRDAYQVQTRTLIEHCVTWPAVLLSLVAIVVASTSKPWDYQLTLVLGIAAMVVSVAALAVDAAQRSYAAFAAGAAVLVSVVAVVLGVIGWKMCSSVEVCSLIEVIG
ncbi:hypothetical protein [Prauserella flavalba]|uniref:hypothetical protein n=1 Tax=Prauserella flavalba TaxID=1477506 RepID=UPI0036E59F30